MNSQADNAAKAISAVLSADALVVAAGAGMSADAGLPVFRGDTGFWAAYPPYEQLGMSFQDLAAPDTFTTNPYLAWGFYGHRLAMYRAAVPHAGFDSLLSVCESRKDGYFTYTTNVDGMFQKAGFDPSRVMECHGSIWSNQCHEGCGIDPFPASDVRVDKRTMTADEPLPRCPRCGGLARPNIFMFWDTEWDPSPYEETQFRLATWASALDHGRTVVVEVGAGAAIPTIRDFSARMAGEGATVVRVNPEPQRDPAVIHVQSGAAAFLTELDRAAQEAV